MTLQKLQYPTLRGFLAASVTALSVCLFALAAPNHAQTMATSDADAVVVAAAPETSQAAEDRSIRPFSVQVPQAALDDLRRRIAATRWPDKETVADQSQGAQLAKLQELVRYWGSGYDWRKVEAKLNGLPQFVTTIDGVDIHFIHLRSRHKNALPVIVTHGWPGSVIEQLKIIGPLTDPTAHGGRAEDAFDIVIPSLPGYGFSGKPTVTGWDPEHIARAWAELMKRLGYSTLRRPRAATGVPRSPARWRARRRQARLGIHPRGDHLPRRPVPPEVAAAGSPAARAGGTPRPGTRGVRSAELATNAKKGNSAYFVTDDRAAADGRLRRDGFTGRPCGVDPCASRLRISRMDVWRRSPTVPDERRRAGRHHAVLADEHRTSSARLYWENGARGSVIVAAAQKTGEISLPVAITVFPDDVYRAPETWARRAYPNLIYFHEVDRGGHFAALGAAGKLFTGPELRAAFRLPPPMKQERRFT